MFFRTIGCNGCLIFLIFLLLMSFFIKYWHIILICFLLAYFISKYGIAKKVQETVEKQSAFKAKPGKVYKQCKVCGAKADRIATMCPKCAEPFE